MHRGDADNQFMHKGGKRGVNHKQHQHAQRHLAVQSSGQCQQRGNDDITHRTQPERFAHFTVSLAITTGIRALAADHLNHLDQRHQSGTNHHSVRNEIRIDIKTCHGFRVGSQQQADTKHAQCPDIADKRGAERRHRDFKHRTGDADYHAHHQQPGLLATPVTGLNGFRRRDTRWPGIGRRKYFGVEHAVQQVGVEQHRGRHPAEHRQN
ncbi:hypothetical protein D3C73_673090 [compost metagenome]